MPRDGVEVPTVSDLWPAGRIGKSGRPYDQFGVVFAGHPDLRRILQPGDVGKATRCARTTWTASTSPDPSTSRCLSTVTRPPDRAAARLADRHAPAGPPRSCPATRSPGPPPNASCPRRASDRLPEDVQDFLINVGPHHPGTHGVLRLVTRLDGEKVVGLDVRIGYMHRSLEKIAENRSYHQIIAFTDRTADYLAAMHNDWVYCLAAEQLLGVDVPERAEYLRVIVGRDQPHHQPPALPGRPGAGHRRDHLLPVVLRRPGATGAASSRSCAAPGSPTSTSASGGVALRRADGLGRRGPTTPCHGVVEELPEYPRPLPRQLHLAPALQGHQPLSRDEALRLGAQGPLLRAAGVAWDLRRDMPYSIYDRFEFDMPVGTTGDVYDRTEVRFHEIIESAKIVRQALDDIPGGTGAWPTRMPAAAGAPARAEAYARLESPRGEIGCYLVSDGTHQALPDEVAGRLVPQPGDACRSSPSATRSPT